LLRYLISNVLSQLYLLHLSLYSFPTRRSSDLVDVEGALVRLNEQGQIEFRLRNVRLTDAQGSPVVVAPLAALELSRDALWSARLDRKSTRLNSSHVKISYAVFCLKKKSTHQQ